MIDKTWIDGLVDVVSEYATSLLHPNKMAELILRDDKKASSIYAAILINFVYTAFVLPPSQENNSLVTLILFSISQPLLHFPALLVCFSLRKIEKSSLFFLSFVFSLIYFPVITLPTNILFRVYIKSESIVVFLLFLVFMVIEYFILLIAIPKKITNGQGRSSRIRFFVRLSVPFIVFALSFLTSFTTPPANRNRLANLMLNPSLYDFQNEKIDDDNVFGDITRLIEKETTVFSLLGNSLIYSDEDWFEFINKQITSILFYESEFVEMKERFVVNSNVQMIETHLEAIKLFRKIQIELNRLSPKLLEKLEQEHNTIKEKMDKFEEEVQRIESEVNSIDKNNFQTGDSDKMMRLIAEIKQNRLEMADTKSEIETLSTHIKSYQEIKTDVENNISTYLDYLDTLIKQLNEWVANKEKIIYPIHYLVKDIV